MPRFNKSPQAHAAEIIIPDSPLDHGGHYFPLPAAEQAVLHEASKLLAEQLPLSSGWHDVSTKDGIRLSKKPDSAQPNDVPWVRGVGILPYPPSAVVAVCTHPAFRMFWDERFVQGNTLRRYSWDCNKWYSVTKSPGPLIQARDFVGMHHTYISHSDAENGNTYTLIQRSCDGDEFVPLKTSVAMKRTRATLELAAWVFAPVHGCPHETEVTYMMRVKMNGSLPSRLVGQLSTEIPLGVHKVCSIMATVGYPPHFDFSTVLPLGKTHLPDPARPGSAATTPPGAHYVIDVLEFNAPARYHSRIVLRTAGAASIPMLYDNKVMYAADAPLMTLTGSAASFASSKVDHTRGVALIALGPETQSGATLDIVLDRLIH